MVALKAIDAKSAGADGRRRKHRHRLRELSQTMLVHLTRSRLEYQNPGRAIVFAAVFSCVVGLVCAQERPVPSDSARVAIPGCAKGRTSS
jgi:hypothetical protein